MDNLHVVCGAFMCHTVMVRYDAYILDDYTHEHFSCPKCSTEVEIQRTQPILTDQELYNFYLNKPTSILDCMDCMYKVIGLYDNQVSDYIRAHINSNNNIHHRLRVLR